MATPDARELIEVLACDIEARPLDAPSLADLVGDVQRVERTTATVQVLFSSAAAQRVSALVAAERVCCAGLDWQLRLEPDVRLTIGATPPQLDAIERMFVAT